MILIYDTLLSCALSEVVSGKYELAHLKFVKKGSQFKFEGNWTHSFKDMLAFDFFVLYCFCQYIDFGKEWS